MANLSVPDGLTSKPVIDGTEVVFAFRGSDGVPIGFTPAQLKLYIGSGMPNDFFGSDNKIATKYLIPAKISEIDHEQPSTNGVLGDIQIRRAWLTQYIKDVGASQGWGTGTPAVQLAKPVLTLGTVNASSIAFSWLAIPHATGYEIYKGGVKIATVTTLNYVSTGLTASTLYFHYVRAITTESGYSISDPSDSINTTTLAGSATPLATPSISSGSGKTDTTYPLGVTNLDPNATGIDVYSGSTRIAQNVQLTAGNYIVTGLTPSTGYTFHIKAVSTNSAYTASADSNSVSGSTLAGSTVVPLSGFTFIDPLLPQSRKAGATPTIASQVISASSDANIVTPYTLKVGNIVAMEFGTDISGSLRICPTYNEFSGDYRFNYNSTDGITGDSGTLTNPPVAGDYVGFRKQTSPQVFKLVKTSDLGTTWVDCGGTGLAWYGSDSDNGQWVGIYVNGGGKLKKVQVSTVLIYPTS